MFPGMGRGMDPKSLERMMKQLGIKTEEIKAKKAVFELENGGRLVIEKPSINAMTVQGKKTYTIMGEEREEKGKKEVPQEDIGMVVEQTGASKEKARKALEKNDGDIAKAIMELKK